MARRLCRATAILHFPRHNRKGNSPPNIRTHLRIIPLLRATPLCHICPGGVPSQEPLGGGVPGTGQGEVEGEAEREEYIDEGTDGEEGP